MIYLNLIPSNLWYLNLRSWLSITEWKDLSLKIRTEQNFVCQFCHISLKQLKNTKYFHCHEMWEFDNENKIVSLSCLITLCSKCHLAVHFGFSTTKNKQDEAIKQIMKVNHWDKQIVEYYLEGSFEMWMHQSTIDWKIDYDSFKKYLSNEQINVIKQKVNEFKKD